MFLCSPALFDRLESAKKDGNCSLSDGMRQLIAERRLRALEIGKGQWQDLDTPEALAHAEGMFGGYSYQESTLESVAGV
jgi:1L-myo-inositol 1-phosphate cytidylyltransferase